MAAAAAVVLLAAASLAVCPAAAAPHAHSRGLVAADAPVAAADSLSSEQVSHKLDSQRATPLGEICSDYRTDGAFTCDIPTLPAKLNSANGKAITFVQPALANGTVLDLVLTLESISGYASMAIERREANGTTHRRVPIVSHSGVERASLHGSRFGAGTHYTVAVVANTAAATYELQIEAYPAEQTVAAADLAALRKVAEVCCDRNCDGVWAGLEAFGGDPVAVCAGDGVVCDPSGHVLELEVDQGVWSCDVSALAPLGNLPKLQKLNLVGMPGLKGGTQTLLRHFPPSAPLRALHLQSLGLTGTLPSIVCASPGGLFSSLESLAIRDVAVRGVLPPCLWRLRHLALTRTQVTGTVPPLTTASPMKFLHLEQADTRRSVLFTSVDLTAAEELTHLTLRHARVAGPLTLPRALSELQLIDSTVSSLAVAGGGGDVLLRSVNVSRTTLGGEVPSWLLNGAHLESLALANNRWTALPAAWHAPALRALLLDDNDLGAAILPDIMKQPVLRTAHVARNRMGGDLSAAAAALRARATPSQLLRFDASVNHLSGSVPVDITALGAFVAPGERADVERYVRLASNALRGEVPSEVYTFNVPGTVEVDLEGNPDVTCRPVAESDAVQVLCGGVREERKELTRAMPSPLPSPAGASGGGGGGGSQRTAGTAAAAALGVLAFVALCTAGGLCWRRQRRLRRQRGLRPYVAPSMKTGTFDIAGPSTDSEKADDTALAEV